MKKGIKQLLTISLIILAIVAITIPVKAATTPNITEKPSSSTNKDQYQLEDGTIVIGKSKFTPGVIVTGENAAIAGANDLAIFVADKKTTDGYTYPKMYVYTFGEWYEYVNGKASTKVSKTSADIWYINNVLKEGLTAPTLEKPAEPVTKYSVLFVSGEEHKILANKEVETGKTVGEAPEATRDGYKLVGWIKATLGSTETNVLTLDEVSNVKIESDTVFFAVWKKVVSVDKYIKEAIKRLNKNTSLTEILEIVENEGTVNFGIKESTKQIEEIIGSNTNLVNELLSALQNENIKQLDVKYGENGVITFNQGDSLLDIAAKANTLLEEVLGNSWGTETLGNLVGKSFSAKVYLDDTKAVLPEGETGEYTVAFNALVDLDDWVNQASKVVGKNYFDITYTKETETIEVKVKDRSQEIFKMTDTDIFDALKEVKETNLIKTITLSGDGIQNSLAVDLTQELNTIEILEWLKTNQTALFGREITDENPAYNSDLVGKTFTVTVELVDDAQLKEDGIKTREYTFKFTGEDITVTFDHKDKDTGDSTKTTQTLKTPGKVTAPENITRDGYTLLGWFVTSGGQPETETKFDFENNIVYDNITLTAKWAKNVSIDNEIEFFENAINSHNETKDIAKVTFDDTEDKIEVDILNNNKTFDDIKSIAGDLQTQLATYVATNKDYIDTIKITLPKTAESAQGQSFEFKVSELEAGVGTVKEKIKSFLNAIAGTSNDGWKNAKIDVLAGKTFTVDVKLNVNNAIQEDEDHKTEESYTVTFKKLVSVDNELNFFVNAVNTHSETNKIAKASFDATNNSGEISILDTTKKFSDILEIAKKLETQLTKYVTENMNYISKITVSVPNEKTFTFDPTQEVEAIKTEIKGFLKEITNTQNDGEWKEKTIQELVGKTFNITVTLNEETALQENKNLEEKYTLSFTTTVSKTDLVNEVIKSDVLNGAYKINAKDDGKIIFTAIESSKKLSEISDTNIIDTAMDLIDDERIEKIVVKYGANQDKSITLKPLSEINLVAESRESGSAKDMLEAWLEDNWSDICTCGGGECCGNCEKCTWTSATNNCLIAGTKFTLEVTLSNIAKFDEKGTREASYTIEFARNEQTIKLHHNDDNETETDIKVLEGLPIEASKLNATDYDEHSLKCWCTDEQLTEKYEASQKVTVDMTDLYADWYLIVNADEDVSSSIKDAMQQNESETIGMKEEFKQDEETGKDIVTIKVSDNTKTASEVLESTGLAKALKSELEKDGVDKIIVTTDGEETYTFENIGTNETEKQNLMTKILGGTEDKTLAELRGKTLTVDIYLNNDKIKVEDKTAKPVMLMKVDEPEYTVISYKVEFKELIDKLAIFKDVKEKKYGNDTLETLIDKNNKIDITLNNENITIDVSKSYNASVFSLSSSGVAVGCGGKTVLMNFLKFPYIDNLTINIPKGTPDKNAVVTKEMAENEDPADFPYNMYFKTNGEALIALALVGLQDFFADVEKAGDLVERELQVKVGLVDGYEFSDGTPLIYHVTFTGTAPQV